MYEFERNEREVQSMLVIIGVVLLAAGIACIMSGANGNNKSDD